MRIFVAIDIEDSIRARIANFMQGMEGFAPDARWVRPESLHVTLKFIGEKSEWEVEAIQRALGQVRGDSMDIALRGHGFFPTRTSARVFWIGIEAGPALGALAKAVDDVTSSLGIPKEDRAFSPHLTLARGGSGSGNPRKQKGDKPNRGFQRLQEKLAAMPAPDFGTMTAREFSLYLSHLGRGGSRYEKLASFALG
ncbi:MAG TPA: RNA 2',3'-cyclic phosphodiesterase [Terriglobales bacterium]|nr:RNA 2',3'-cyclic phosphodiesterase [Terriglobales bacterium]